jgi:drug/metabolite transporter (DMT)-like permease
LKFELFDKLFTSTIIVDSSGIIIYANDTASDLFRIRSSGLQRGIRLSDILGVDQDLRSHIAASSGLWSEFTLCALKRNKSHRFSVSVQNLTDDHQKHLKLIYLHDLSLELKLEDKFRKEKKSSEQAHQQLLMYKKGLEIFCFFILFAVTGFSFLAIKYAIISIPPFLMNGLRFFSAGIIFLLISYFRGNLSLVFKNIFAESVHSLIFRVIGYGGLSYSILYIPSGLAAVSIGMVPIVVSFIEFFMGQVRLTKSFIYGLILGLFSTLLFAWSSLQAITSYYGLLIISMVVLSWSIGAACLGRRRDLHSLPFSYTFSGLVFLILSIIFEDLSHVSVSTMSEASLIGFLYLFIFMTLIADPMMTWLMTQVSAAKASSFIYVKPLVAVIVGAVIAKEPFNIYSLIGLFLVVLSLKLIFIDKRSSN